MTLSYLSVCSGIEAASVAWMPLGWVPVAFSEIAAFPSAVLAHHYGSNLPGEAHTGNGVPNFGDMTRFKEWPDVRCDVLVGGTPCQSFSLAGLRGGLLDPRGNLALVYLGIADRYRPRWVVWENVPGVLSSGGGRDFGSFLGGMAELGYGFAYRVLDAQYFRVAQRRRRVFVVGYLGDWRCAAEVLFERESLSGHPAPSREAKAGPAVGTLTGASGRSGHRLGPDEAAAGQLISVYGSNDTRGAISVSPSLTAHPSGSGRMDFETEAFVTIPFQQAGSNVSATGQVTGTLTRGNGNESGGVPCIAFNARQDPDVMGDRAGAINCGSPQDQAISGSWGARRLTPTECERLQSFPDGHTDIPWGMRRRKAPDGLRYQAIGNSINTKVLAWIGARIARVDAFAGGRA